MARLRPLLVARRRRGAGIGALRGLLGFARGPAFVPGTVRVLVGGGFRARAARTMFRVLSFSPFAFARALRVLVRALLARAVAQELFARVARARREVDDLFSERVHLRFVLLFGRALVSVIVATVLLRALVVLQAVVGAAETAVLFTFVSHDRLHFVFVFLLDHSDREGLKMESRRLQIGGGFTVVAFSTE